jgi:hypothetical protein
VLFQRPGRDLQGDDSPQPDDSGRAGHEILEDYIRTNSP